MGFLRQNGISFTNYDVDKDSEARKRLIRLNGSASIPVALINGRKVVGFSEEGYRELLQAKY